MLIEFSVENFRSIKEKVTFSMVATKDSSLDRNLILGALDNECLLKSAAIYGANASGKTNLLMAMDVLKFLVINSHNFQKGVQMPYYPFRSGKSNQDTPTRMEITFLQEKVLYHYEISYNKTQVISESLYYYPNKRKSLIF
jgi:Predicted ATPases